MTATATLIRFASSYGFEDRFGVLSEHLAAAEAAGIRVHSTRTHTYAVDGTGHALPVLCSELYAVSGDGTVRCGRPVTPDSPFCEAHKPDVDLEATCEHGLALWLCAGPGHYPIDL